MNTDKIYAEQLVNEYSVKDTSKVMALKKLDIKAKKGAKIFGFTFGIVSALLLGTGMCLCMGQIGANNALSMVLGVIIGILGISGVSINYFIYTRILEKDKKKYAYEIIELAKEISEKSE